MVNHTHNDVILRYFLGSTVKEVRDVKQPERYSVS